MIKYIYDLDVDFGGISFQSRFRSEIKLTSEILHGDWDDSLDIQLDFFENCIQCHSLYIDEEGLPTYTLYGEQECIFNNNTILPDKFCLELKWFDRCINLLTSSNLLDNQYYELIDEYKSIHCCRNDIYSINSETAIIKTEAYYKQSKRELIKYSNLVLSEILKLIPNTSLNKFDELLAKSEISIKGENTAISINTKSEKEILYNYLINVAKEIKLILEELLVFFYPIPNAFSIHISQENLTSTLLYFKKVLFIEQKKAEIRNSNYEISLFEIKEIAKDVNNKDCLREISKEFKVNNLDVGEVASYLDKVNEYYLIKSTPNFQKKKLGIIILLLYNSKILRTGKKYISFQKFKKIICNYYNKENVIIHQNKILDSALTELELCVFLYKDFQIDITRMK